MEIVRNSVWSTLSVIIRGIISFVINKVVSISFGPSGITFLSHFQNLSSIFILLPNDGVNKGIIKYLSHQGLEKEESAKIISTGFFLSIALFLGTAVLFFSFKGFFPNPFPGTELQWILIAVGLFGFQVLNYYLLSIILSRKKLPVYVLLHLGGNIISLILVIFLSYSSDYKATLLGWAAGPAIASIASLAVVGKLGLVNNLKMGFQINPKALQNLGEYILVALSILIFSKITDFGIREFAIIKYNPELTGLWQAVVRLSDFYLMAFLAFLNMVYYPKASELSSEKETLIPFARKFFIRLFPLLALGLLVIYALKTPLLILFFNEDFVGATVFFPYQLAGDLLKMHSWLLSFLLLAQARTRLFVVSQGIFAGVYLITAYLFTHSFGIEGLPMAHFCRYGLYWFFMVIVYKEIFSKG